MATVVRHSRLSVHQLRTLRAIRRWLRMLTGMLLSRNGRFHACFYCSSICPSVRFCSVLGKGDTASHMPRTHPPLFSLKVCIQSLSFAMTACLYPYTAATPCHDPKVVLPCRASNVSPLSRYHPFAATVHSAESKHLPRRLRDCRARRCSIVRVPLIAD